VAERVAVQLDEDADLGVSSLSDDRCSGVETVDFRLGLRFLVTIIQSIYKMLDLQ
jgi:hypothetical protein